MSKRIGILGGSFDPIHIGHLNLAVEALERANLDEVWFCLSHISPYKTDRPPAASVEDRLEMLNLALNDFPHFKTLDIEVKRPPPSYMVDTLKELRQNHPHEKFFLILAPDTAKGLSGWKEVKKISTLCSFLVGQRNHTKNLQKGEIPFAFETFQMPLMEISSTRIRERLKNNLTCAHLLPRNVLDTIYHRKLYLY